MIVVDTNVLAYFLIDGDRTQTSEAVRRQDDQWHVPALFVHEWINVIALHVKKKTFSRDEALRVHRRGLASVLLDAVSPDAREILQLASRSGCSSYDCQFVALAQRLRTTLVTVDAKVLRAFPDVAVSAESFAAD